MHVQQALSSAVERTRYLLFERGSRRRWLSFGVLHMLAGSAGATMGRVPELPRISYGLPLVGGFALVPLALPNEWAPWVLGGMLGGLLVAGLLTWLGALAKVVLIENVVHDRDALIEPMGRLAGLGGSVFAWSASMEVTVVAAGLGLIASCGPSLPTLSDNLAENAWALVHFVTSILNLVLPLSAGMLVLRVVTNELVVPLMYHDDVGVLRGLARVLRLLVAQPARWLAWAGLRTLLGVLTMGLEMGLQALVIMLGGMVLLVPTALGLMVFGQEPQALLGVLLLAGLVGVLVLLPLVILVGTPFTVFLRCFSLYCLQSAADFRMLPPHGRGTVET